MQIVIVCHAGVGIGLGHLSRTLVIADALNHEFEAVIYIIIQGQKILHPDLNRYPHLFLPMDADLVLSVIGYATIAHPDLVIMDLSPLFVPKNMQELFNHLKKTEIKAIGVDSLSEYAASLDLLFIPSFNFDQGDTMPVNTPVLWGWDCFLLRTVNKPLPWQPGNRILILTGGSDVTGLGETLPKLLDNELIEGSEIHWVKGAYSREPGWLSSPRLKVIIHDAPSRLDDIMQNSNYALTVYGVSFFELIYYGIPTVVFSPYGTKDAANLHEIQREQIAEVAKNESDAVLKLKQLMTSNDLANKMSLRAKERITGNGGQKLAHAIRKLLN